ncbi:ATP-binding protein [Desulfonatronum lacustre]|uniref:ATP-binding protein n=1 Tax=Desulfonatronum lacustre TaxID=66849 RepID=UPI000490C9AB|nr:ATP-binding protein [Desulfonatronum lacustre]
MRFEDMKISRQLRLGLGLILLLVVGLAALAWVHSDLLWRQTEGLYDHPLTVRRALSELKVDILVIHWAAEEQHEARTAADELRLARLIQNHEASVERQFAILYERYLGPRADIDRLEQVYRECKTNREEVRRLILGNRSAQARAIDIHTSTGLGSDHLNEMMGHVQVIDDFASLKAEAFYQDARSLHNSLNGQLAFAIAAIILGSMAVAWFLLRGIREPLKTLVAATDRFHQGDMNARSDYRSANEMGALSASFNVMAAGIQTQMQIHAKAALLSETMLRENEVRSFCRELLKVLLEQTGSQAGAIYFLNEAKTAYEHSVSIGLGEKARAAFSAADLEGELGAALATRRIQRITDIPDDTRFAFIAVSGELSPREILTIPVGSDHQVMAMISLSSIHGYDDATMRLVQDVWSVLTARMEGVLAFREARTLADRLAHWNRELEAQKKELGVQADELTEQNIELDMQKRQLEQANRLKNTFLANMSHELRTPLNSVIALAGVLERRLQGAVPEEEYDYLGVIKRNGRHLLALINDILDLARIEAGKEDVAIERFPLKDLVDQVVEVLEPQAREKGIALVVRMGRNLPPLASDFSKCRHILQNIAANAVKFTEQGQVEIAAEQDGEAMVITVTDTGIGIPEDRLSVIFDEFRQADESTSKNYGGTGLGLSIARRYAEMLGGDIAVRSVPGQGTTFTVTLPLILSADKIGTGGREPADLFRTRSRTRGRGLLSEEDGRGKSILLVEDSEPAVIQLRDMLEEQGYDIRTARNGKEALDEINRAVPDAVILDLMMPGVDGFAVLRAIRGQDRTRLLPVLILTAKHVTREELHFLTGNNIHQLIRKGDINRKHLLAAVANMVAPTTGALTTGAVRQDQEHP